MSRKKLKSLSKFLALILRHQPDEFGLELDERGFTLIDDVWREVRKRYGDRYTRHDMQQVIAGDKNGKKRYEQKGRYIRAMYGHSLEKDIVHDAAVPPEMLYHGTSEEIIPIVREEGLKAMNRQHVHLTTNLNIADNVARRHSRNTIMLRIRAKEAHNAGYVFHHAENEHYLTKNVPPEFIEFPDEPSDT